MSNPPLQKWPRLWRLKRVRWPVFGLIIGVCVTAAYFFIVNRPEDLVERARDALSVGDLKQMELLSRRALWRRPRWDEAALMASEAAGGQGNWEQALAYLEDVDPADTHRRAIVHTRRASILDRPLARLDEAEREYRAALEVNPEFAHALFGLCQLLAICGRQSEARPLVLRMLQLGGEEDLLMLLARADMGLTNVVLLERARTNRPDDINPLLGMAWHHLRTDQPKLAVPLLERARALDRNHVVAAALLGMALVAEHRISEFAAWQSSLPPEAEDSAEVWMARAKMSDALGDRDGAVRCYWESLRRAPESRAATVRLSNRLAEAGEHAAAAKLSQRVVYLQELEVLQNRTLFAADTSRPELIEPLAQAYERAGRLWEALGWYRFASGLGIRTPAVREQARALSKRLSGSTLEIVARESNVAAEFDFSKYSAPDFRDPSQPQRPSTEPQTRTPYQLRDSTAKAGLEFLFDNGIRGTPTRRAFEFTGGGVAVLDFDGDLAPDLFFTQGLAWPADQALPVVDAARPTGDRLFRNDHGSRLRDVTESAGISETDFGQGATAGDMNSDGFPDLYVGNIGQNRFWVNVGDGTFVDATASSGMQTAATPEWTTSVVMADLDGDGLADLYDSTYARGLEAAKKACRHSDGTPRTCPPSDFDGAPDRIWINGGDGRLLNATQELLGEQPFGLGLGLAVWSDGVEPVESSEKLTPRRLSLYVANDTTPAFYFRPQTGDSGAASLRESAISAGLAFNAAGKATGCMGVALGDINHDGHVELLVTNFLAEPNSFFMSTSPGFYEDRSRGMGLEKPSYEQLGFGTQFIDLDNDGLIELFVANGHVDDLSQRGRPYRMPPQLFRYEGAHGFEEIGRSTLGEYFSKDWLGRAAVRLDWNLDGRNDIVVGHLEDQAVLLTNETAAAGRSLSLALVATGSERSAVGATVEVVVGGRRHVQQLTTGDGYQCRNEQRILVGLNSHEQADEVVVHWMDGRRERFTNLSAGRYVLREGGDAQQMSSEMHSR